MAAVALGKGELVGLDELLDLTEGPAGAEKPAEPHVTAEALSCHGGRVHERQLAMIRDQSPYVVVLCSRRAGKTYGLACLSLLTALERPRQNIIYIGLSKPHARKFLWNEVWRPLLKATGVQCKTVEDEMTTTFPNGSVMYVSGTDDVRHIESFLGNRLNMAIIDECFPAGTLIDGRPIETVRIGDTVACVDHTTGAERRRRVVGTRVRHVDDLVTLRLGVIELRCTENHPVFVRGRGYVAAADIHIGDLCCVRNGRPVVEGKQAQEDLLASLPGSVAHEDLNGQEVPHGGDAPQIFGADDKEQSHGAAGRSLEDDRDPSADETSSCSARGERSRPDSCRSGAGSGDRLADERGSADRPLPRRVGVSDLLQVGFGGHVDSDGYRGRWSEPLGDDPQGPGREEDGVLVWARVESVSRVEPGGPGGTAVYNLEVEGAHTYFANDVLVHNCQSQSDSVLVPLTTRILPNALLDDMDHPGKLVMSGTIPEVNAGQFMVTWNAGKWSRHNWSRFQNPYLKDQEKALALYLEANPGLKEESPEVQREWYGRFVFDASATAHRFQQELNLYDATVPEWLPELTALIPSGSVMASKPWPGIEYVSVGIDPASEVDRMAVVAVGWGPGSPRVQHLFEWVSRPAAKHTWNQLGEVLGHVAKRYSPIYWHYDAGSSKNELDTFQRLYGVPVIKAAEKSDLAGQVRMVSGLLSAGKFAVMRGSCLQEDYEKSRWEPVALARGQYHWASSWHPDPGDAARYALRPYFDAYVPPKEELPPSSIEAHRAEVREILREAQAQSRMGDERDESTGGLW